MENTLWKENGGMKKTSKLLLTGAGVAAGMAAMGAATYASTKLLVQVALDRQEPKIANMEKAKNHLRGYKDCGIFFDRMAASGKKLKAAPHQTVTIQSYDGYHLVGHWFPVPNPHRILIAMHGWRSSWWSDFGIVADFWKEKQCSVLYAEQRGQGSSGGDYMGFGMMERHDCIEWIKWVNGQVKHRLPVYLVGVSMGASTVLMTADMDLPDNVRGIIADCGFTSPHDIWKHVAQRNLHLPYSIHGGVAERLCQGKIHMSPKACSTLDTLKNSKVPVLFAHGTDDHFVPVEMTYQNYQACAAPKELLIVPGADHGMCYYREPEKYQYAIEKFWQKYDKKAGEYA